MENKSQKPKKKIPWGLIYIIATIIAVVLFGVFNREFGSVLTTIQNLTPGYLFLSVFVTVAFFLFEGFIIMLLMNGKDAHLRFSSSVKIGLIGMYYSYITPSASGGQPMQSAYLRRYKIPVGLSTAALFVKFICYQCAFLLCSLVSFILMLPKLRAENPAIIPFIIIGLFINGGSVAFFSCMFIKKILAAICRFGKWLVGKLRFLNKRRDRLNAAIDKFHGDFIECGEEFKNKKGRIALGVALSIPQFVLQMSVIWFVFRAFGYNEISYLEVLAVQSMLQVSVSFMPMPGASGAQEFGFSSFFRGYFVNDDLYTAVMVWRFFTYYLVVIAGALLIVIDQFLYDRKKKLKS